MQQLNHMQGDEHERTEHRLKYHSLRNMGLLLFSDVLKEKWVKAITNLPIKFKLIKKSQYPLFATSWPRKLLQRFCKESNAYVRVLDSVHEVCLVSTWIFTCIKNGCHGPSWRFCMQYGHTYHLVRSMCKWYIARNAEQCCIICSMVNVGPLCFSTVSFFIFLRG